MKTNNIKSLKPDLMLKQVAEDMVQDMTYSYEPFVGQFASKPIRKKLV